MGGERWGTVGVLWVVIKGIDDCLGDSASIFVVLPPLKCLLEGASERRGVAVGAFLEVCLEHTNI